MNSDQNKKLFLLDAYALIFRAYYAFIRNPRVTSRGLNTSAIFGFLLALEEVLQKRKPTHIAVVFDTPTPTFRHEMYPEYKAHRDETPEDIRKAVPYIKRLIEAYRIPVIDYPGFEADDVIGTLARKASEKGFTTFMVTPDKDYAQLVSDNVYMLKPSRSGNESLLWGVDDIRQEFSVKDPGQVIDILALMGDAADNIPGAPGVGPKTAMKLIGEYGSVEELFKHTDQLKGKLKETIENNRNLIEISKKLATIEQNVPVELDEKALILEVPDSNKLKALFDELEFRTVAARILAEIEKSEKPAAEETLFVSGESHQGTLFSESQVAQQAKQTSIETVDHEYTVVDIGDGLSKLISRISTLREFCFDTETTSINPLEASLVSIAFSWEKGKGLPDLFPRIRR